MTIFKVKVELNFENIVDFYKRINDQRLVNFLYIYPINVNYLVNL